MSRVRIEKVKISESEFLSLEYESTQDALLHMIYLKTGLVFLKPEVGKHPLLPDNLREFQNFMIMLNKMETVIDTSKSNRLKIYTEKDKFTINKRILANNISEIKNYFYNIWIKKNIDKENIAVFNEFRNESISKKNKFLYMYFKKYTLQNDNRTTQSYFSDNVQFYNISLADVFEVMGSCEETVPIRNLITAFSIEYSFIAFDILHLKGSEVVNSDISDLFHGRILEFSKVEEDYFNDKNSELLADVRDIVKGNTKAFSGVNSLREITYKNIVLENYMISEGDNQDEYFVIEDLKYGLNCIVDYILLHMIIYYGYRADSFIDPIVRLGNKFYEPTFNGRTQKYTLSPSGFFYKAIDIRQFLRTLFEEFTFINDKLYNNVRIEKTIEFLTNHNQIERFISDDEDGSLKLWNYIISVDPEEILPYHSFEFLNVLSNKIKSDTLSRWRRDKFTVHTRLKRNYYDIVGEMYDEIINKLAYNYSVVGNCDFESGNMNFNSSNYKKFNNIINKSNPLNQFYFLNGKDTDIKMMEKGILEDCKIRIINDDYSFTNEDLTNYCGIIAKYNNGDSDNYELKFNNELILENKEALIEIIDYSIENIIKFITPFEIGKPKITNSTLKGAIRVNLSSLEYENDLKVIRDLIEKLHSDINTHEPRKVKTHINSFLKIFPSKLMGKYENEIAIIKSYRLNYVNADKTQELIDFLIRFRMNLTEEIMRLNGK